jgi:hypothetical protein
MTAHVCPDTAYPAAAMPDECTCGGELMANPHDDDGPGNYCPHGDYSGRNIPLLERDASGIPILGRPMPLPEDDRCTGTASVDDGVIRHTTECPVHTDTDGMPEWKEGEPMPNPDEYNGWSNRETWAANLWLTNTPELYEATLAYGPTPNEYTGASTFADMMAGESLELIAELLRNDPRNGNPEMMLRDIGSAWRIDWREIYAGLLEHLGDMAATAAEDES